ncbi:unnamed protein product [Protopolystoma xenopodis]|uniref:Uncharacterized protein n=1 Tax=Protopolystoma xenopodis TaxID=117903 RepID=A0A3S5AFT5_9PLAT|nr:unnamed protein product [Protopolystoma xenopodis]
MHSSLSVHIHPVFVVSFAYPLIHLAQVVATAAYVTIPAVRTNGRQLPAGAEAQQQVGEDEHRIFTSGRYLCV